MQDNSYLQRTFGLAQRTALVTGAGRGIGLATARALGLAGARVVVNDLDATICEEAVKGLRAEGIMARAAVFDVTDGDAVNACQRALAAEEWHVDILVNNAGNQNRKPLVDMRPQEWQQLLDVHVNGAFHCSQAFLRGMCSRGFGRILMMS
ncbi:MAG: SDR family NAD(P)-dependent oxidoreductase, partial [Comamonadaceae bacterium]